MINLLGLIGIVIGCFLIYKYIRVFLGIDEPQDWM